MPSIGSSLLAALIAVCAPMFALGKAGANESVMRTATDPNEWPIYGKDYANTRFSQLEAINTGNVGNLKVVYSFQLGSLRSNESTPLVVGDTMYVSTSWGPNYVYALEAATGARKWTYEVGISDDVLQFACCDVSSRGVSYADEKIFVGRLDGKLVALDAGTGRELWKADVVDYTQGSVITSPPLVVKDKVIAGFGGGEYGVRGSLQAYDINTGKLVWKTYTVPLQDQPNGDTWKGDSAGHGGGAAWLVGSYDPKTDTVYWGTGNPGPWNTAVRSTGDGNLGKLTNLYTASTLALDPDTGAIKWWVQGTPADAWDYDGVNELVLAELKMNGETVPAMMKADRNGFFFVLNRETGKVLSAEKYAPTTWAVRWDINAMRPIEAADKRPGPNHNAKDVCPSFIGAKNWQPMSYSPKTGLVYIPSNNLCMDSTFSAVRYQRGAFYLGVELQTREGERGYNGELIAWDPVQHRKVWGVKSDLPFNGGALATGGDLVFWGDLHGDFRALDARTGNELWKMNLGSGIGAGPISYAVNGKQYVAVVVGRSATMPWFLGDVGKKMTAATPEGGALFVFAVQ